MKNVLAIATALTLSSSLLIAGPVNNENITTFTAGSPAVAADVNSTIQADCRTGRQRTRQQRCREQLPAAQYQQHGCRG